jgi:hypothetical protein
MQRSCSLLSLRDSCRIEDVHRRRSVRERPVRLNFVDDLDGVRYEKRYKMFLDLGFKAGHSSPRTAVFWLGQSWIKPRLRGRIGESHHLPIRVASLRRGFPPENTVT